MSRGGFHYWATVELTVGVACAILGGLLLEEDAACVAVTAVVGSASAVLAGLILLCRPYDTLLDTLQASSANALAAVAAIVALSTDSSEAASIVIWIQVALMFLSVLLSLYGVIMQLHMSGETTSRGVRLLLLLIQQLRRWRSRQTTSRVEDDSGDSAEEENSGGGRAHNVASVAETLPASVAEERLKKLVLRICKAQHHKQRKRRSIEARDGGDIQEERP